MTLPSTGVRDLAGRCGVAPCTVRAWMEGAQLPLPENLGALAAELNGAAPAFMAALRDRQLPQPWPYGFNFRGVNAADRPSERKAELERRLRILGVRA